MNTTATVDHIRLLRHTAERLRTFFAAFHQTYSDDSRCDKKGYGWGKDNRFEAFRINISFDSWAGFYGTSTCSKALVVDKNLAAEYVEKALTVHQEELFRTAARLMIEDAAKLADKAELELEAARDLLKKARDEVANP